MAFIGKNVIENLTTAMYENLLIVYREYIQNAADSIDTAIKQGIIEQSKAVIDVDIDEIARSVTIEDNGVGIRVNDFKKIMSSIADSTKDSTENKGFRGIGRLGGISTCKELRFSCSHLGENVQSIVVWNAEMVREILLIFVFKQDTARNEMIKHNHHAHISRACAHFIEIWSC